MCLADDDSEVIPITGQGEAAVAASPCPVTNIPADSPTGVGIQFRA
jgi:hypothetical protein